MKSITINNQDHSVKADNLGELVVELGLETSGMALALNGAVVKRVEWAQAAVKEGDSVVVVTAVYGG